MVANAENKIMGIVRPKETISSSGQLLHLWNLSLELLFHNVTVVVTIPLEESASVPRRKPLMMRSKGSMSLTQAIDMLQVLSFPRFDTLNSRPNTQTPNNEVVCKVKKTLPQRNFWHFLVQTQVQSCIVLGLKWIISYLC